YYNARLVELYTIQLEPDKYICIIPEINEGVFNNERNYIKYYTSKVVSRDGKIMRNTPIYIVSKEPNAILDQVEITTNPLGETDIPETITPYVIDQQTFLTVYTDKQGKITFRVYPKENKPVTLELLSHLFGVSAYYSAPSVYFLTPPPDEDGLFLMPPIIPDANGGILIGGYDKQKFDVQIDTRYKYSSTDVILFFNKDKNGIPDTDGLIYPIQTIGKSNNYNFKLPYDVFPENEQSELYYIIVSEVGNSKYSGTIMVRYVGGSPIMPPDNVTRTYNKVSVYSSYADYQNDPLLANENRYLRLENDYIVLETISNYVNNNGVDLYLKIIATNDKYDHTKKYPQAGEEINVNVYVRSRTKKFIHTCTHNLSDIPDEDGEHLCTSIIKIHHPELTGVASYSDGKDAWVYFEYYTIDKYTNEKNYSFYWKSMIDTFLSKDDN
ncbi:hypothetical protein, partial [Xenorhabdus sp. PB30.3]|uniref:hypothetical protein n=1 Tax=Xenorhabdus sp. PB30.3 TaxID=2788941 RepID=UPI001E38A977